MNQHHLFFLYRLIDKESGTKRGLLRDLYMVMRYHKLGRQNLASPALLRPRV